MSSVCGEPANGLVDQFPDETHDALSISINLVPSHVYVLYDPGRDGGLKQELSNNGWTIVAPAGFNWEGSNALEYGTKQVSCQTAFSFPAASNERLMGVVILRI